MNADLSIRGARLVHELAAGGPRRAFQLDVREADAAALALEEAHQRACETTAGTWLEEGEDTRTVKQHVEDIELEVDQRLLMVDLAARLRTWSLDVAGLTPDQATTRTAAPEPRFRSLPPGAVVLIALVAVALGALVQWLVSGG